MADRPTHIAYVVTENRNDQDKNFWSEVGAVWPHSRGDGFDLEIHDQLSVAGRIVCTPRREPDADRPETSQRPDRRQQSGPSGRT